MKLEIGKILRNGMGKHRKLMTIKSEELSIEKIQIFKLLHEIKRVFNIVTL